MASTLPDIRSKVNYDAADASKESQSTKGAVP